MRGLFGRRRLWPGVALLACVLGTTAVLALSTSAAQPPGIPPATATASPEVTVSLSPRTAGATAGDDLAVDVAISTTVPLRGAQFGLSFDPALVEVLRVEEGGFFRDWAAANGAKTIVLPQQPRADNQNGNLLPIGVALLGGPANAGQVGSGVLATVHLVVKASGPAATQVALVGVVAANTAGMSVPRLAVTDAQLTVGETPGGLGLAWSPVAGANRRAPSAARTPVVRTAAPGPDWVLSIDLSKVPSESRAKIERAQAERRAQIESGKTITPVPSEEMLRILSLTPIPTPMRNPDARPAGSGEIDDHPNGLSGYKIMNAWYQRSGERSITVYAGARRVLLQEESERAQQAVYDTSQGIVWTRGAPGLGRWGTFDTPGKHGPVRVVDAVGERLTLVAEDGTTFYFDARTGQFVTP